MKGMIYEFVVIASSISPCVGRKMKKLFHDIFYGLLWKFQLCHLVNICILESTFGFALVRFYTLVSTSASLYWEVVIHCCLQLRHSPRRYLVLCRPTKIFNNNRHGLVRLSTIRRIISDKRRFFLQRYSKILLTFGNQKWNNTCYWLQSMVYCIWYDCFTHWTCI